MSDIPTHVAFSPGLGEQVGILTLGQLRQLTDGLPADTQVIVNLQSIELEADIENLDIDDGTITVRPPEFANVHEVHVPDFDESFAVELRVSDTYDGRQS